MLTEIQHICLADIETTKVPALDLYENYKSKNKYLPFFNCEINSTHSPKNQNLSLVSREMAHNISHGTNT